MPVLKNLSFKNPLSTFEMPSFKRTPVFNFISKRSGPFDGSVKLTRDRVYIIPTKAGLIFSLLLLTLLIGSINYEMSLGFLLTFLLASIGNVALLSTWKNIAGLELKRLTSLPVFSGESAIFNVQLINHQLLDRRSIIISKNGNDDDISDCAASSNQIIRFKVQSKKRGLLDAGKFRLYSEYPTGLFIAWTWADLSMSCTVYPEPDKDTGLIALDNSGSGDADRSGNGMENFSHLRKYHQGDSLSRISWKTAAKNNELFSKEFLGSKPVTLWISWEQITARNNEHRLSIMTALIIEADKKQHHYGLELPEKIIQPANGHEHFHQCLTALALF